MTAEKIDSNSHFPSCTIEAAAEFETGVTRHDASRTGPTAENEIEVTGRSKLSPSFESISYGSCGLFCEQLH
jgi:hypothetical protein